MNLLTNKNTVNKGLALASGGARGAYQAGAMLALAEKDVQFSHVSGTSIGTLNGAFYVQGNGTVREMQDLCDLWREIGNIGTRGLLKPNIRLLIEKKLPIERGTSILNSAPLEEILDRYLNYEIICSSSKIFVITTIPSIDPITDILVGTFQKPVYFYANKLSPTDLRKALLAATAIPIAFPSVDISGTHFTDAGLSTPLPSKVLYDIGIEFIVSIFLSDSVIQNRLDYPKGVIFQLRPSTDISKDFFSMLDFSSSTINYLIDLGYNDVQKYMKEVEKLRDPLIELNNNRKELDDLTDKLPIE